jgi:N-acetylglucosaminyl-diphospho-decaprenol L-rhamnosyltransferase
MSTASITSLIVTYNSGNEILNLLADLCTHGQVDRIIVIDNASADGTVDLVQRCFSNVLLIRNSTNLGFAKAVNQGFALCDTEYVLLLNPDIRIDSPGIFHSMEEFMKRSRKIAAVAPLQFKNEGKDQKLNFTWSYVSPKSLWVYLSFLLGYRTIPGKPILVSFLNAGCLLIRKSAFDRVGKLNEKYFLFGEEPDLFLKLKRYGFECYLLPNIDVTHYRERSLKTIPPSLYLQIKLQAVLNVIDALIVGWSRILLDKFTIRGSRQLKGN